MAKNIMFILSVLAALLLADIAAAQRAIIRAKMASALSRKFGAGLAKNSRIFDGTPAIPHEFPFIAFVTGMRFTPEADFKICAGTILDSNHILTAASCFVGSDNVSYNTTGYIYQVVVGAHNINEEPITDPQPTLLDVESCTVHPAFDPMTLNNNIAIITTAQPIDITNPISKPICLAPANYPLDPSSTLTIAAWGAASEDPDDVYNPILQKTIVKSECNAYCKLYSETTTTFAPFMFFPDTEFCADQSVKGFCNGDAGGPAFAKIGEVFVQYGLMSFQKGCNQSPGFYAKISAYKDWIQTTLDSCFTCSLPSP